MRILLLLFFIISILFLLYFILKPPIIRPKKNKKMVACQYCDVYILEQEAFNKGNGFYCSLKHLKQDQENPQ